MAQEPDGPIIKRQDHNDMHPLSKFTCKAIIFDLDGTLLYTLEDIADAANHVLETNGFKPHSTKAYCDFIGNGAKMLMMRSLPKDSRDPETVMNCLQLFEEIYTRTWNVKTRLYAGIPEMLNTLPREDIKMAILSNKPHSFTLKCVDRYLSSWAFDPVFGMRDSVKPKPDPQGALLIARQWRILPENILYVGDSGVDMKTAGTAGMMSAGVTWGFRSKDELEKNGARHMVHQPAQLAELILQHLRD